MDYVSRLRPIARAANMENDDSIKIRIAQTTSDDRLREQCLKPDQTLRMILEWQSTRERSEALATSSINAISQRNFDRSHGRREAFVPAHDHYMCTNCGYRGIHDASGCPARTKICHACRGRGHFELLSAQRSVVSVSAVEEYNLITSIKFVVQVETETQVR